MKALAKTKAEPGIWMIEAPMPEPGPEDVLIKVHKTGICGTDVHIYKWDDWAAATVPVPMITGHEFAGEIVETGSDVRGFKPGDRVTGEGHLVGMNSRASRAGKYHLDPDTKGVGVNVPGAFGEYVVIPAFNAVKLPDSVSDDMGAILDPLGNAVHTALAFDLVGEDVLITGAGPIGIMSAAVARQAGARHVVITDVNVDRLHLASEVAPDVTPVNIEQDDLAAVMARLGMREGFDVGLEMSGAPQALNQMIDHLVMGGRVALLGVPARPFVFDLSKIVFRMVTLKGIYGREMFETWHKMLAMLESGLDVERIITHRLPVDDYKKGFEIAADGKSGKVVLDWQ